MEAVINGQRIAFAPTSTFVVEVSLTTNPKSGYRGRYYFTGANNLRRALVHYHAINIGKGYKKRLRLLDDHSKQPILREASSKELK